MSDVIYQGVVNKTGAAYRNLSAPAGEAQFVRQQFGMTDEQILRVAKDENYLRSLGYTPQQAAEYARRAEPPPAKIGVVDERKGLREPINLLARTGRKPW